VNTLYIWEDRVFYTGRLPPGGEHRLGAAALCIGVDGTFQVLENESGGWRSCRSVLIPPGCSHELDSRDTRLAILFLEPESEHYTVVQAAMAGGDWQCLYELAHAAEASALVRELAQPEQPAAAVYRLLDRLIDPAGTAPCKQTPLDPRVEQIVKSIRQDPARSQSVETLAEQVHLSPTRLTHLFKQQTGMPLRRFRQWSRMKAVVTIIAAGGNLTEAALDAGFVDSAHFSRAFRNMFGTAPSSLFNRAALAIVIGETPPTAARTD